MEKSLYGISIFIREIIAHFSHIFELNNGRPPPRHHYVNMGGEHFLVCVFNRLWSANVCFFSGMDAFRTNFYCLSINNNNECHTEYCPFLTFMVSYTRDALSLLIFTTKYYRIAILGIEHLLWRIATLCKHTQQRSQVVKTAFYPIGHTHPIKSYWISQ